MVATLFALVGWRLYHGASNDVWTLFTLMPPVTFGAYAIAMSASAAASDDRDLRRAAWIALTFAAATAATIGHTGQFALIALGALLTSVLPGLALLRREQRGA
jgi:hypothetical protein